MKLTTAEAIAELHKVDTLDMPARLCEAHYMAIKALEQEPKWIPVSERLPEENGYYLTTTMYHRVYCDYWEEERFNRTEVVIAWMPLPEPYKAESEDKE